MISFRYNGKDHQARTSQSGHTVFIQSIDLGLFSALEFVAPHPATPESIIDCLRNIENSLDSLVSLAREGLAFLSEKGNWFDARVSGEDFRLSGIEIARFESAFVYCDFALHFDIEQMGDVYGLWTASFTGNNLRGLCRKQV